MSDTQYDTSLSAALALREARSRRVPIAPISASHGIRGLEAAYAVAAINTRAQLDAGRRIVGKKVGLTSKAVQTQLGVDQPDFGILFDDMEILSGQDAPTARPIQPKVEAEVAFRAAYWLARTMAQREQGLRAGEVILSGALGPMVPVVAGDLVHAQIGALGTVSCRMG